VGVKVVRFLDDVPGAGLVAAWERAMACCPDLGRPSRVVVGEPVELDGLEAAGFAGVDVQWFPGEDGALVNEAWLVHVGLGSAAARVVAEEVVVRGADYLRARWAGGGERFKMMSFGRRNPRWTQAEFSERWRTEAGRVGGSTIPDELRGLAYVQNHPLPGREWPYDAVNEVWFERLDHLRRRGEFLAERLAAAPPAADGLMAPTGNGAMFVRETVIRLAAAGQRK
jgi:hypothetical protein